MTGYGQGRRESARGRGSGGPGATRIAGRRVSGMAVFLALFFCLGLTAFAGVSEAGEFSVPGLIEAKNQATMRAKASGTVGTIAVREGENVRKGQVLIELENARERAVIKLAEASLEKAKAALAEERVTLQNCRKDLARKEMMRDIIARKDYENARDIVLQHEAALAGREGEVKEAEATLVVRTAELENTMIRAPFNGTVTEIHVKTGETVAALSTPICDVAYLDTLYVQVAVPIQYLPQLKRGQRVGVKIEQDASLFSGRFTGEIGYINPVVDAASRRVKIKVTLHNPTRRVRPGMVAEVFFPAKK